MFAAGRTVLSPLGRQETVNGNLTDGDDEILESLVKTATKAPGTRTTPRERKRTRHADRKSCKYSHVASFCTTILCGGKEVGLTFIQGDRHPVFKRGRSF
jgi:hypothetical protein